MAALAALEPKVSTMVDRQRPGGLVGLKNLCNPSKSMPKAIKIADQLRLQA
jgi:hypothetical protein